MPTSFIKGNVMLEKILKRKDGVSRMWWWNRFKTWLAHLGKNFKYNKLDQSHLKECVHCKKRFEKWLEQEEKRKAL
jgi:hypothetical protein